MPTTERILSTALTICAVVFAGVLIKREFFDPKAGVQGSAEAAPSLINNWRELRNEGIPLRSPDAPVVVVEFSDLECPACKQFHSELKDAANDLHSNIGLVMLHYPLSIHRFANAAARALECASSAGVPGPFVDVAFAKQDSFGLKPWIEYAKEAGVIDTASFQSCIRSTDRVKRIDRGRFLGDSMGIHGTPAVIINGWRFSSPPDAAHLREALAALASGHSPNTKD